MAKLTKQQTKLHNQACDILTKPVLTEDDKFFVLENWREDATHNNAENGAFFTPLQLANDFAIEVSGTKILDLCAGIGMLSFMHNQRAAWNRDKFDITCVELNPDYIEVGKKILPEATWIQASVFEHESLELGDYDTVISNPPFGSAPRYGEKSSHYTGNRFEYHVIDIGMHYASYGVFIIPQTSAPFKFSANRGMEVQKTKQYVDFEEKTGLVLNPSCGIDTSIYDKDWHGVSPRVEIVTCEVDPMQRLTRATESMGLYEEVV